MILIAPPSPVTAPLAASDMEQPESAMQQQSKNTWNMKVRSAMSNVSRLVEGFPCVPRSPMTLHLPRRDAASLVRLTECPNVSI